MEKSYQQVGEVFRDTVLSPNSTSPRQSHKSTTPADGYISCTHQQLKNAVRKAKQLTKYYKDFKIPEGNYRVKVMSDDDFDSSDVDTSNAIVYRVPGCVIVAKFD
jgi:hypothetical protein